MFTFFGSAVCFFFFQFHWSRFWLSIVVTSVKCRKMKRWLDQRNIHRECRHLKLEKKHGREGIFIFFCVLLWVWNYDCKKEHEPHRVKLGEGWVRALIMWMKLVKERQMELAFSWVLWFSKSSQYLLPVIFHFPWEIKTMLLCYLWEV